ncbi:MAG: MarR family transcriptional regulator [Cellvibrionaceae bacterium]
MKLYEEPGLGFLILDVARMLRRSFQKRMVGSELTLAQSRALVYVARNPGIRQVDLADRLEVQPITLARLIDQLEASGLAERRPDPTDRRAYQLHITPKAVRYLDDIERVILAIRQNAFAGISEPEIATLFATLEKVNNNLAGQQRIGHD